MTAATTAPDAERERAAAVRLRRTLRRLDVLSGVWLTARGG